MPSIRSIKIQVYLSSIKERDDLEARARSFGRSISKYVRDLILQDLFLAKREDPSSELDLELSITPIIDEPLSPKLRKKIPKLLKDGDSVSIDDIFDAMDVK